MTPRHLYLRDYSRQNKQPIGCVAVEVDTVKNQIRYAFSTCSPSDAFSAKLAKDKAYGRLKAMPIVLDGPIPDSSRNITRRIMQDIFEKHGQQHHVAEKDNRDWRSRRSYLAWWAANNWLLTVAANKASAQV